MEQNPFDNARPALQDVHLTLEEKNEMRSVLLSHMRASLVGRMWNAWGNFAAMFTMKPLSAFALMFCLLIGSTSAVAFAAEGSLPGDLLYPVKTGVNEPVAGFFKSSLSEKVAFEWELVERRLTEAEQLAENRLAAQKEHIVRTVMKQRAKAEALTRALIERERRSSGIVLKPAPTEVSVENALKTTRSVQERHEEERQPASPMLPRPQVKKATPVRNGSTPIDFKALSPAAERRPQAATPGNATGTAENDDEKQPENEPEKEKRDSRSVSDEEGSKATRAAETGEKMFEEMDRIFEKHETIVRKLELPLPYVEARMPAKKPAHASPQKP